MGFRERATSAAGAALADPKRLLRAGAAGIAVLLAALGVLALGELAEPGAVSASGGASAPDGGIVVEGEIARVFAQGAPPTTVVYLRGADALEFRLATDLNYAYKPGDFVALHGTKQGNVVQGQTIRHAVDPALAAAPDLAAGAVIATVLALEALIGPREATSGRISALLRRFPGLRRVRPTEAGAASGTDDNHSGAPAPKG